MLYWRIGKGAKISRRSVGNKLSLANKGKSPLSYAKETIYCGDGRGIHLCIHTINREIRDPI
jgi:hypothetical protein